MELRFLARLRTAVLVHALIAGLGCHCWRLSPGQSLILSGRVPDRSRGLASLPDNVQAWRSVLSARAELDLPSSGFVRFCCGTLGSKCRVSPGLCLSAEQVETELVDAEVVTELVDAEVVAELVGTESETEQVATEEVEPKLSAEVQAESADRMADSLKLLDKVSEEHHPGHQPGRFNGPGPEYNGMVHDGLEWKFEARNVLATKSGNITDKEKEIGLQLAQKRVEAQLVKLNEDDRHLATKFEKRGGLALCLKNAYTRTDELRDQAKKVLKAVEDGTLENSSEPLPDLSKLASEKLQDIGLDQAAGLLRGAPPTEQAMFILKAADMMEERDAVMRNVWSDIEFDLGEEENSELLQSLEFQLGKALVETASAIPEKEGDEEDKDGANTMGLVRPSFFGNSTRKMSESDMTDSLADPRNLGAALDLVGAYLKNYEIDKADRMISRILPLCRKKGGTWLVKGLDKLTLVRMKQHRPHDALEVLKEIEQVVPFAPDQGWEFYDILYRNFACAYSSLDEPDKKLEYTRKSIEVKRNHSVASSWFDIWDLGKAHARVGQKTEQRGEMRMAYDLIAKAGEIHRKAEPSSKKMLAKILSNVGEVALGIGDTYKLEGNEAEADAWYLKAEPYMVESYELFSTSLGFMKPLTGWSAGNVAHCMVRLENWEKARTYLGVAFKVECTKDSTTPGAVIELTDRLLNIHNRMGNLQGMANYSDDLQIGLEDMRSRGWDRKQRDVWALTLQKASTAILAGDDGSGSTVPLALKLLTEAEMSLELYQSEPKVEFLGMDKTPAGHIIKPDELLRLIKASINILKIKETAGNGTQVDGAALDADALAAALTADMSVAAPMTGMPRGEELFGGGDPSELGATATGERYCLAGNWNGWNSFVEFTPEKDGSAFTAMALVPPGQDVQFQVFNNYKWDEAFYPAKDGSGIMGPSSDGHEQNWKLAAPTRPAFLRVRFDPTGDRQINSYLESAGLF